jgi:class 3 adenylate cyclase
MVDLTPALASLHQNADPRIATEIERLIREGTDRELNRINVLALAQERGFDDSATISAFLHAARTGLFDMAWNILCPGCGGVLQSGASLKSVRRDTYHCSLCAAGYEPTLDEMVEVTFTVSPRVRRIAAHDPQRLPPIEYYRQLFFSSGQDLPPDFEQRMRAIQLEMLELAPGERAVLSLTLPSEFVIVFDPVTHATQFIDVQGEPAVERQSLAMVITEQHGSNDTVVLRPGPVRLAIENHADVRVIPNVCVAGDELHQLLARRRPFLTAKRLLTHQTFRDLYRTDTLDLNQRLRITSLTFLFTDLKGSTELYDRVGDLAAYDLVRAHFGVLNEIVAAEAGAVVKTIGDAVMATFPGPERAVAAALRMREAMAKLNAERGGEDLVLKIGIHEGPCLAVMLNERQDYFGQTVNIASRVQNLAVSDAILATGTVVADSRAARILDAQGIVPAPRDGSLRGVGEEVELFELT